jgi:hypothetical protein
MFFVSNLLSYSQAGRRGFEPRLPLHVFNNLHPVDHFVLRLCSVYHQRDANPLENRG